MAQAPARGGFVTTMAALSLALGVLGLVSNLLQWLAAVAFPAAVDLHALGPADAPLPPWLDWLQAHMAGLSLLGALGSALLCWVAWALLQRREWARLAFIALLLLTGAANFAVLPLLDAAMGVLRDALSATGEFDPAQSAAMAATLQRTLFWACLIGCLLVAAVQGWIAWRLSRPAVKAEFLR